MLARRFWPGPLTLVLPKKKTVPGIVTSGGTPSRSASPAHPLARRLLKLAGVPLAAPSANLFGYVSPTSAAHVRHGLGARIKHILDGGHCRVGVESTIVDLTHPGQADPASRCDLRTRVARRCCAGPARSASAERQNSGCVSRPACSTALQPAHAAHDRPAHHGRRGKLRADIA